MLLLYISATCYMESAFVFPVTLTSVNYPFGYDAYVLQEIFSFISLTFHYPTMILVESIYSTIIVFGTSSTQQSHIPNNLSCDQACQLYEGRLYEYN